MHCTLIAGMRIPLACELLHAYGGLDRSVNCTLIGGIRGTDRLVNSGGIWGEIWG